MNELATQAANDTNTSADRTAVQSEVNALTKELNRIQHLQLSLIQRIFLMVLSQERIFRLEL